jgi:hypothetical protein
MRLRGQCVAGFYAAAPEAIRDLTRFLIPPKGQPFAILDPCSGKGEALKLLGSLLKCDPRRLCGIELADNRAEDLRNNLPEGNVLAPASFFGCWASLGSFSLVWLNAPYDHQSGGEGRVELAFLRRATEWLMPGGILAFVVPEDQIEDTANNWAAIPAFLRENYQRLQVVPFPANVRPYKEVCVFAVKREREVSKYDNTWEQVQAQPGSRYYIPAGRGPVVWKKTEPTDRELAAALAASPLRSRWQAPPAFELKQPPLSLGLGHVSLLLSSGQIDGIVQPDNGRPPHVVRGTSRKKEYVASETEIQNNKGKVVGTKTIKRERIELVVRTIDTAGRLRTYTSEPEEELDQLSEE